ncbi:hypothetical protein PIB30_001070 [Stylosanthes scabra]|uniref:Transmembrane protein n=1 Tax=Stylosanthes scabra TaxID=79078 RepID=A0ABU6U3X8_9FABA|nr:hypothetical protein [Stylosanthes scabra]
MGYPLCCESRARKKTLDNDFGGASTTREIDQSEPELDPEKEKLRRKVVALRRRLKSNEWKMKVAVYVGVVGWLEFLYLLFVDAGKTRPHHVMPLRFG